MAGVGIQAYSGLGRRGLYSVDIAQFAVVGQGVVGTSSLGCAHVQASRR